MAGTVQPSAGEIKRWAVTINEPKDVLIKLNGFLQLARRHIVMVEHTNVDGSKNLVDRQHF
jgi:hypothetical protein